MNTFAISLGERYSALAAEMMEAIANGDEVKQDKLEKELSDLEALLSSF